MTTLGELWEPGCLQWLSLPVTPCKAVTAGVMASEIPQLGVAVTKPGPTGREKLEAGCLFGWRRGGGKKVGPDAEE